MTDIFLSYAHEDLERIHALVAALDGRNLSVFWDRSLLAGDAWRAVIPAKLREARCVVVVWTSASVKSNFVVEEAENARKRGVLVPVLMGAEGQPFGFGEVHVQDLGSWDGDAEASVVEALFRAIDRVLARPAENVTPLDSKVRQASSAETVIRAPRGSLSRLERRSGGSMAIGESMVPVPRARLDDLRSLQDQLSTYVSGHHSSREIAELCARVVARLERGKREVTRLSDSVFWDDLHDDLNRLRDRALSVPDSFRERCPREMAEFQKHLGDALAHVGMARDGAPQAVEGLQVAMASHVNAIAMHRVMGDVAARSRQQTDHLLKDLGDIIERIAERIQVAAEELQGVNAAGGYRAKLRSSEGYASARRARKT